MQNQELADLAAKFKKEFPRLEQMPVVSGFDAFVDEMARIMEWNEEEKAAAAKQLDETIAESSLAYLK